MPHCCAKVNISQSIFGLCAAYFRSISDLQADLISPHLEEVDNYPDFILCILKTSFLLF